MGRKEQGARLSPFPLTLIPVFPLCHCAGRHESGIQRRRQMERRGHWGRGWWSQRPRATDLILMGTQEWLVASVYVLGQKQAETGQPVEGQGRASTTSRRLEIKQRVSLSPSLCSWPPWCEDATGFLLWFNFLKQLGPREALSRSCKFRKGL